MEILIIILTLYFVNLILDYPLQGSFLAEFKAKDNYLLFVHSAIWGIGMGLCLIPFGIFAFWKLIMLVVGHYIIDYWKCKRKYKSYLKDNQAFYIDQIMHVIQLFICLI